MMLCNKFYLHWWAVAVLRTQAAFFLKIIFIQKQIPLCKQGSVHFQKILSIVYGAKAGR
jgi:hypothetical protein